MKELPPLYNPKPVETKIYKLWEKSGYFNPDKLPGKRLKKYIVYMPLPNVTGALHMGHALDNTAPDVLVRYYRMKGYRTLWLPGTDHAGIATQYVVEKELKKGGKTRWELGREKFIERVWEWKNKYGNIILEQLKKLGVSADWSRKRFTMDPKYSQDVLKAFIHYYNKGWIYQGLRTVNWCPRCATSLSELELEYTNEKTILYYIKYGPFTLATVRPETKFGDTALAVNPKDKRYKNYIGKTLEVESLNTKGPLDKPALAKIKLQIVGDDAVDMKFGTGVIKVTPAHDITDFEIAKRHKLPMIQVIDNRGRMNENAGKYAGLTVSEARKKIVEDLRVVGLIEKEEPYEHRVAKCYRCGTTIEPLPSKQWFLKMERLAQMALEAVKKNKVKILPKNFERPYFDWLKNIRDWTISRQIWWGHRLPVWQCKCQNEENSGFGIGNSELAHQRKKEKFIISLTKPKQKCPLCQSNYEQVPDVLDTWFSSALWPFAGLSKADQKNYYPGDLVSNAREILNLWDARMIFSGLEFMKKVPFKNVLIHGTVLTKEGKRMSKSLGTGVDPLKYVEEHGADATRFAIIWQASGQDIRWDEAAVQAGRKFANKIWNASRFVLTQIGNSNLKIHNPKQIIKPDLQTAADKKIMRELAATKKKIENDLQKFEFSKALHKIYDFFWHNFCDVYIEQSKKQIQNEKLKGATLKNLFFVLIESLKMIHPFMPFITEEIWHRLPIAKRGLLMIEKW
jgi:valyl-tRNA synthetase